MASCPAGSEVGKTVFFVATVANDTGNYSKNIHLFILNDDRKHKNEKFASVVLLELALMQWAIENFQKKTNILWNENFSLF